MGPYCVLLRSVLDSGNWLAVLVVECNISNHLPPCPVFLVRPSWMGHVQFWLEFQTDVVAVVEVGNVLREPNPFHVASSSCHHSSSRYRTTAAKFLHQVHNPLLHHLHSEKNLHADKVGILPWVPRLHVDQASVFHLDRLHHLAQAHY